jgi:hypothetical protein
MKKRERKPKPENGVLFGLESTVPSAELARVPSHAESFTVPVSDRTIMELDKIHNGYGSEHMREAARGLDRNLKLCTVSRKWCRETDRYMKEGGAGGMQLRLRACYPDFRAYCLKVSQEDGQ